ncbi:MAG: hypothetical protein JW761_03250 [Prolixibacteraceae bacterium]|nr:hypothetical protein [Prolixibacteraceae bacterium]
MEERKCLECGEPLKGRADQKFCNDLCRNAYNNKKLGKSTKYIRRINRILKTNHSILEELNSEEKTTVYAKKLEKRNFNFDFHTHYYKTRNGNIYFFCYDQGYLKLDNNKYLLVKKEDI